MPTYKSSKEKSSKRPGLGTGKAENAAKKLEGRGSRIDRAVAKATGNKPKPKANKKKN